MIYGLEKSNKETLEDAVGKVLAEIDLRSLLSAIVVVLESENQIVSVRLSLL